MTQILSFPPEVKDFIQSSALVDTSGHSGAKTYYIEKESGFYLKMDGPGKLLQDYQMLTLFSGYRLSPEPVLYLSSDFDYLIVEKAKGQAGYDYHYWNNPDHFAYTYGQVLRQFHDHYKDFSACASNNSVEQLLHSVFRNIEDKTINAQMLAYKNQDIRMMIADIEQNAGCLINDTIIHGDYCIPNVLFSETMEFQSFIDVNAAGQGDRHYDLHWGRWSLWYNFKTKDYEKSFFEGYGKEMIESERLRLCEMISYFE